jgi:peroxiredoxin
VDTDRGPVGPAHTAPTRGRNPVHYLTDTGEVADAFGLRFEAPADYLTLLGLAHVPIPVAATYLIDARGEIAYAYVHPDPRFRADPADLPSVPG